MNISTPPSRPGRTSTTVAAGLGMAGPAIRFHALSDWLMGAGMPNSRSGRAGVMLRSVARGRLTNVDMSARRRTGHRAAKGNERNSALAQIGYQRLSLAAVRVQRHVHGIAVIESQAV